MLTGIAGLRWQACMFAAVVTCVGMKAQATGVSLGTAGNFAVLGGSTVTNTGLSVVTGDLGVSPGTAITGFGPGIVVGTIHAGDSAASQAHADATTAYNTLASMAVTHTLTGQDLGGMTLMPGVYFFSSEAQLTGILTLDGLGQVNPLFVFQIGTTLTTASVSSVLEIDGAVSSNVFFQVGTSATLGLGTQFAGNIIAGASDTLTTGVSVDGRVIALIEGVTLDTNVVSIPTVPEPSIAVEVMVGGVLMARRRRGMTNE